MNERSIFLAVLEIDDPSQRSAYLDQACAGDPTLRGQVEQLLQAHQEPGQFMERPALALLPSPLGGEGQGEGGATLDEPITERPGTVIGPYKLLEQIGEGGFGVVFMAEQQHPIRRKVALKVLKPGMDTRQVVARFEAERQALALMDHPNIARVIDGGETTSARPYFVMELVKGILITDYCDQNQVPVRERLELFVQVCQAVQHAHQKGIIHRDIKPSNVLVTLHDGAPVPKIIDFGIAKAVGQQLTDKTLFTNFAQLIGTPLYMSPEQAALSGLDVDTRSDIYSLGVLLYELLTGTTPFHKDRLKEAGYDEMRRIIREEEPPKPSLRIRTPGRSGLPSRTDPAQQVGPTAEAHTTDVDTIAAQRKSDPKKLSQLFRGELDWIVMKCLEKDRNRRYESASALAADVKHYLNDQPVLACPPTVLYRLGKLLRRRPAVAALVGVSLVAVLALLGAGASLWDSARLQTLNNRLTKTSSDLERTNDALDSANREKEGANLQLASALVEVRKGKEEAEHQQNRAQEQEALARRYLYVSQINLAERARQEGKPALALQLLETVRPKESAREDLRGPEWYHLWNTCHGYAYALSGNTAPVTALEFSPNGQWIASGAADGKIILWNAPQARIHHIFSGNGATVKAVRFTEDSKMLVAASEREALSAWDVQSGRELAACSDALVGQEDELAWNAMERLTRSQQERQRLASTFSLFSYCWQGWTSWGAGLVGDGAGFPASMAVLARAINRPPDLSHAQELVVGSMAFGPDNRIAVVSFAPDPKDSLSHYRRSDAPGGVLVADIGMRNMLAYRYQAGLPACSLALSPCGQCFAWGGEDRVIHVAEPAFPQGGQSLAFNSPSRVLAFSYDRHYLASAHADYTVRVWDLKPRGRELILQSPDPINNVVFSPAGGQLAACSKGITKVWKLPFGKEIRTLPKIDEGGPDYYHYQRLAYSADGHWLSDGTRVTEVTSGREVSRLNEPNVRAFGTAFSPEGKLVATAAALDQTVYIWETLTGSVLLTLKAPSRWIICVAFSPDGRLLAAGSVTWRSASLGGVKVWEVATGREVYTHPPMPLSTFCVAFSPDGKWLAEGGGSYLDSDLLFPGEIKILDTQTWAEIMSLEGHTSCVWWVAFSPDGRRLASASGRWSNPKKTPGEVKVWDLTAGQELLTLTGHSGCVHGVSFSPNGKVLASGSADGTIRFWGDLAGLRH